MLLGEFSINSFCSNNDSSDGLGVLGILRVVGYALTIFKIAIPFIIIFYGMMDFGKAVTAEKQEEIKTSAKRLLYRAIAGIIIFFVPTLVIWLFKNIVSFGSDDTSGFEACENCLLHPGTKCQAK